jgi:flagellar biogenesis protein FliO
MAKVPFGSLDDTGDNEIRKPSKVRLLLAVLVAILLILLIVFITLYVVEKIQSDSGGIGSQNETCTSASCVVSAAGMLQIR